MQDAVGQHLGRLDRRITNKRVGCLKSRKQRAVLQSRRTRTLACCATHASPHYGVWLIWHFISTPRNSSIPLACSPMLHKNIKLQRSYRKSLRVIHRQKSLKPSQSYETPCLSLISTHNDLNTLRTLHNRDLYPCLLHRPMFVSGHLTRLPSFSAHFVRLASLSAPVAQCETD